MAIANSAIAVTASLSNICIASLSRSRHVSQPLLPFVW
jgi:hypothetical protein